MSWKALDGTISPYKTQNQLLMPLNAQSATP